MQQIADLKELIMWARSHNIVLGRVRVDGVEVDIVGMLPPAQPLPSEAEAKQGLYADFGGELLKQATEQAKADEVYDEED